MSQNADEDDDNISRIFARKEDRGFRREFAKFLPSKSKRIHNSESKSVKKAEHKSKSTIEKPKVQLIEQEKNAEAEKKIADLTEQLAESKHYAQFIKETYSAEIEELRRKIAQKDKPSDTTCVYRLRENNPLDEAYEEYLEKQALAAAATASHKRRKLDEASHSGDGVDAPESDAQNAQLVRDLRLKVEQQERMLKVQKECALQYRQIVSLLTGYQVKMRDEGLCEVQSIYGQGGIFCFKRREDAGMDLLDNECARQWSRHVENYLAKYDSIPAFLAAIVLTLVENDASMLSNSVLDYTKDTQKIL